MDAGAGGIDVTSSFVSLDPAFHAMPPDEGTVLLDQAGPYKGPVTIDTDRLSNGVHRLFIRAGAPCNGAGNNCGTKPEGGNNNVATHYSVQVVTFNVAN